MIERIVLHQVDPYPSHLVVTSFNFVGVAHLRSARYVVRTTDKTLIAQNPRA